VIDSPPRRVLVVEDDRTVSEVLCRYLTRAGFEAEAVHDGQAGLDRAVTWLPDLVVLDLMLPGLDGIEVCRRLHEVAPIPVVMVTARAGEDDRVLGLEVGADDYVTKPFSPRELTARINAVLRRVGAPVTHGGAAVRAGEIVVDPVAHEVTRSGAAIRLTAREFDLLWYLASHPRQAFRREDLLEQVWGWTYGDAATVTVHVRRLRMKLESNPSLPEHLVTVPGGYRFQP